MYDFPSKILHKKILIWSFFILFILSGCQENGLQLNIFESSTESSKQEIEKVLTVGPTIITIPKVYEEKVISIQEPEKRIVGGIISPDPSAANLLLAQIDDKKDYNTVVLIADTDYKTDKHKIFTYDSPGILAGNGLSIDNASIEALTKGNIIKSLGAIPENSHWNSSFLNNVIGEFPNSKFILISMYGDVNVAEPYILAHLLRLKLPEDSLILGEIDLKTINKSKLSDFQNAFMEKIIINLDERSYDALPTDNTAILKTIGKYFTYKKTKTLDLITHDEGYIQVLYNNEIQNEAVQSEEKIFLVFFGDVMLGRYVRTLMERNGLDYPFRKMDENYLRINDLLIANLEGPVTKRAFHTNAGMTFSFFPDTVELLDKYHFDALGLANNHILNMKYDGYLETIDLLKGRALIPFGHPSEINAQSVGKTIISGQRIAFLGLNDVDFKIDGEMAVSKIKSLIEQDYLVIPFIHWGDEYVNRPNNRQKELAHKFIDAGALAIVGHHPHVPQTYETYNGHPIFYSLGNAIFDQYWSAPTQEGLSIAMEFSEQEIKIYFMPIKLDSSQMRLMDESESKIFLERFVTFGDHSEQERKAITKGILNIKML